MIAKKYRLSAGQLSFRAQKQIRSEYFFLKAANNSLGHSRFAVIVSLRVDKSAVRRHFWKRRLLDWADRMAESLSADMTITVLPPLNRLSERGAEAEFKKIFSEITRALS